MILRRLKKFWNDVVYLWCFIWGLPYYAEDEYADIFSELPLPLCLMEHKLMEIARAFNRCTEKDIVHGRISKLTKFLVEYDIKYIDALIEDRLINSPFKERWESVRIQLEQVRKYNDKQKELDKVRSLSLTAGYLISKEEHHLR